MVLDAAERLVDNSIHPNKRVGIMKHDHEKLIEASWTPCSIRPADKQLLAYFFEPFCSVYVGEYDAEEDSVHGRSGFTSWVPEVLCWYPLPR